MKKGISVLLTLLCTMLLCGVAYADNAGGIFAVSMSDGFSAVPKLPDGTSAAVAAAEIPSGAAVQDFYEGAQRITLTYSGTQVGEHYLVMVLKGSSLTPSSDNVVYIDQITAESSSIEYNIYPIRLENGEFYHVCISTSADGGQNLTEVGSFQYGKDQKLYTVVFYDEDGTTPLSTKYLNRGDMPEYDGEAPTKAPTEDTCFVFDSWSSAIAAVAGDTSYKAVYTSSAHSFGEPEWTWEADCSAAKATFTCSIGNETRTVEASISEPAENEDGSKTYTASAVLQGVTYTNSKTLSSLAGGTYVLNIDYIYLQVGGDRQLSVFNVDTQETVDSAVGIVWETGNADIATVDATGKVTGLQVGATNVTVKSGDGSVDLTCTVQVLFSDVSNPDDYYFNPVYWAKANGVTSGTSPTTFSPTRECTRGQIVTFLWNAAGRPEPTDLNNPFEDVTDSDYYYKPVLWAKEHGVTAGTSPTTFSPGRPCTRGQIVTFLWKALGSPAPSDTSNPFEDVTDTDYYFMPVLWAKENGITSGTSATTFSPGKACTRAQAMTFLYKAVQ